MLGKNENSVRKTQAKADYAALMKKFNDKKKSKIYFRGRFKRM